MFERDPIKNKFYNSQAWRKCSKAYAASKCYVCEMCKNKYADPNIVPFTKQFHVHHKIELTVDNISNPDIALNFDNFILLCLHCHNLVHSKGGAATAPGLEFDSSGQLVKINEKSSTSRSKRR